MTWAAILSGLLKLFNAIGEYLNNAKLMQAGKKSEQADQLKANQDEALAIQKEQARIDGLSDDAVADELRPWIRKDGSNSGP